MLEKRGAVMETAVKVSRILKKRDIDGAIIGGVAVVLHGYVRTTTNVDVASRGAADESEAALDGIRNGVPIRLWPDEMVQLPAGDFVEIEGVTTLRLADLISIKLKSGLASRVRAQDIADVIGLIRAHHLGGAFSTKLDRAVRKEFKKLVEAVRRG